MAFPADGDVLLDSSALTDACAVVHRYLTQALFGGDERALVDTVADPELVERAWLFWAAFPQRTLDGIEVLFADADGARVACHFTATMVQEGPWVNATMYATGNTVVIECTGVYMIAGEQIVNYRETWR